MTNMMRIWFLVSLVIILVAAILTHRAINGPPGAYDRNLPFYLLLVGLVLFTTTAPAYLESLRGMGRRLFPRQDEEAHDE